MQPEWLIVRNSGGECSSGHYVLLLGVDVLPLLPMIFYLYLRDVRAIQLIQCKLTHQRVPRSDKVISSAIVSKKIDSRMIDAVVAAWLSPLFP